MKEVEVFRRGMAGLADLFLHFGEEDGDGCVQLTRDKAGWLCFVVDAGRQCFLRFGFLAFVFQPQQIRPVS